MNPPQPSSLFRPLALLALGVLAFPAVAGTPLLVGGCAHGEVNIRALADLGLGNFVWIPAAVYPTSNVPWDEENSVLRDVETALDEGMAFMVSVRRGVGQGLRPGGYEYGGHTDEFLDEATVRRIAELAGNVPWWLHGEELDADLIQQGIRPTYRTRSPELFGFSDRRGGRLTFERELRRLDLRYRRWGGTFLPNLCTTLHHSGFRAGAPMVIAELLEHLPTTELQLAYLRGGARQFGAEWGVWVSPWWIGEIPCEDKTMWPASHAVPGGGHSATSLRRCLYLSWVSGARLLCTQDTPPLLAGDGQGGFRLASWGRELSQFWATARQHPDPMDPIVPLALLVDRDNGWCPAHLWIDWNREESVWGKLPPDRGDAMLSRYLDVLLPGYGRTSEAVAARQDAYPGYFAATPCGPFDILSSDAPARAMKAYPAIALMGEVEMTEELLGALREYVDGGGRLLVNTVQLRRREAFIEDEEFLGLRLGLGQGRQWTRTLASNQIRLLTPVEGLEPAEYAEPWFTLTEVEPIAAEAIAVDGEGHPVLLRHRFGKGWVYTSTPEYGLEGWDESRRTLGFLRIVLDALASQGSIPLDTDPDVSWIASRQGDDLVIALANHHPTEPRRAVLQMHRGTGTMEAQLLEVSLPPEDVGLVRVPFAANQRPEN